MRINNPEDPTKLPLAGGTMTGNLQVPKIGIGVSATELLTISGSVGGSGSIRISNTNTNAAGYADEFLFNSGGKYFGCQIAGAGVSGTFAGITNVNLAKFLTNADNIVFGSDAVSAPIIFIINTVERFRIASDGKLVIPLFTTAAAPAYVLGGMYFDTTLNKLRIGGATGWETVTSV